VTISDAKVVGGSEPKGKTARARQLDAIAWALFLIWIGIAVLAKIGWGWSLLGISGIMLAAQATLWRKKEKVDRFSVACGLVFLVGGAWELFGLTWPLAPVLLILLGVGVLWNAVFGAHAL
jgi:hypothetical protein